VGEASGDLELLSVPRGEREARGERDCVVVGECVAALGVEEAKEVAVPLEDTVKKVGGGDREAEGEGEAMRVRALDCEGRGELLALGEGELDVLPSELAEGL
jgi:hypothetical protein